MKQTMRTTVELDDQLIEHAMQLTGLKSKSEIVDLALRKFIEILEDKHPTPPSPSPPAPPHPALNCATSRIN